MKIKLRKRTIAVAIVAVIVIIAMIVVSFNGIGGATKFSESDQKLVAKYQENSDICNLDSKDVIRLCKITTNGDYEIVKPKKYLYKFKSLVEVVENEKTAIVRYKSKDNYEVIYTFNRRGLVETCIYKEKKDVLLYQSKTKQVKYKKFANRWNLNDVLKFEYE